LLLYFIAYLEHISSTSEAYLEHSLIIPEAFLEHVSTNFLKIAPTLYCIFGAYLKRFWNIIKAVFFDFIKQVITGQE
jgi:hypothetical protein